MEFWSTVTFKACDEDEQMALREVMQMVAELQRPVAEAVFSNGTVVASPEHARPLAEALQRLSLREARHERIRRGLIKALAFNQHYIHNTHGWEPANVAHRHNRG